MVLAGPNSSWGFNSPQAKHLTQRTLGVNENLITWFSLMSCKRAYFRGIFLTARLSSILNWRSSLGWASWAEGQIAASIKQVQLIATKPSASASLTAVRSLCSKVANEPLMLITLLHHLQQVALRLLCEPTAVALLYSANWLFALIKFVSLFEACLTSTGIINSESRKAASR